TGRYFANRPGGSVAPSRTAAIGGTRVARRAGRRLATIVTRIPASSDTTIGRVLNGRPVVGSVNPREAKSQKRNVASGGPRKRPVSEASEPMTNDSRRTERRI